MKSLFKTLAAATGAGLCALIPFAQAGDLSQGGSRYPVAPPAYAIDDALGLGLGLTAGAAASSYNNAFYGYGAYYAPNVGAAPLPAGGAASPGYAAPGYGYSGY